MRALVVLLALAVGAFAEPQGGRESTPRPTPAPQVEGMRFRFPIDSADYLELTSSFGWRVSPTLHYLASHDGIDIATIPRAQVVAAGDGIVEEIWPPPGVWWVDGRVYQGHPVYGGMVILAHPDGLRTLYAHLSAVLVVWHQALRAGQVLGNVGATGEAKGAHLHLEIRVGTGTGAMVLSPLLYVALPGVKG